MPTRPLLTPSVALLVVVATAWLGCAREATNKFQAAPPFDDQPDAGAPDSGDLGGGGEDALAPDVGAPDPPRDAGGNDASDTRPDAATRDVPDDAGAELGADSDLGSNAPPLTELRVVVLSDLNGSYGSTSYGSAVSGAVERILELEPDLVLSTGDMVAGQQAGHDYRAMWDAFHDAVSDPLAAAGIPFAVTPGNHDASGYSAFVEERAIFVDEWQARWPDLEFLDDSDYPLRYSFTMGPALFISLDDTLVGPISSGQLDWIEEQLVAGALYPIKIIYGHVPLYPFAVGREDEILADFELEELLVAHGVTAFISGHHHAYFPGRRGDLRLVGMACLGSGPRSLVGQELASERSLLLLEVSELGVEALEALTGPSFDWILERETLPTSIGDDPMLIWRDDVAQ